METLSVFTLEEEAGICIATIALPNAATNIWNNRVTRELHLILGELEKKEDIKGLIFISGKQGSFISGDDIAMLARISNRVDAAEIVDGLHGVFARINALPFPTVAAIDGRCIGTGLEFALACTARIASDSRETVLGLPECDLGIFPGAGGTQRLPRLIGAPAFDLILEGAVYPSAVALELGVIDKIAPAADGDFRTKSLEVLHEIISEKTVLKRPAHDFSGVDELEEMALKDLNAKGKQASELKLAIKAMQEGLKVPLNQGLEIEKDYFLDAVLQSKGTIHTMSLKAMSDKPRELITKGFVPNPRKKVAIVGFGTMGRGIAIDILRKTEMEVVAKEIPEAIEPGREFVRKILREMEAKKKLKASVEDIMARLSIVPEFDENFADVDLVIEAVFENIRVKERVYHELCRVVPDKCILASNTSSIPLNAMSPFVSRLERFAGLHFFSPAWKMEVVEVIQGEKTTRDTMDNLLDFVGDLSKRPVVCRDNPGFVVNALLISPYFMTALDFIETGNPIEEVDRAFASFGMPVGPIRLMDEIGIDVLHLIIKGMHIEQNTLGNLIDHGRLGVKKCGQGFFLKDGSVDPEALALIHCKDPEKISAEEMRTIVLTKMATVGRDLLDRDVVSDPRMIDMGMIWGTGFPADKGGPLKWADLVGLSQKLFGKTFYDVK